MACGNEVVLDEPFADGTIGVHFTLNLPGGTSPVSTRSGGTYDENSIDDIHILIFEHATDGSGAFVGLAQYSDRTDDAANHTVTCRASLPMGATFDIVVLANLPSGLNPDQITDLPTTIGTTKADFIAWFEDACPGTPWNMSRAIPLWGEVTKALSKADHRGELSIDLIRSLARIDVKVNSGITDFEIETIRLYNPSQNWQVMPAPTNWNATTKKATAPTASQSGYQPYTGSGGYLYTLDTPGTACEGLIYTPEAPAGSSPLSGGWTQNTCLIIGGYFGVDKDSRNISYYRVDFTDAAGNYLPLLRNHHYVVTINSVLHHGQDSPEAALAAHPVNAMYTAVGWTNQSDNVTVEGKYDLTVDRQVVYLPKSYVGGSIYKLVITTNHPKGWTAKILPTTDARPPVYENMFSLSSSQGWAGSSTIYLSAAENDSGDELVSIVEITAGDIVLPVKVIHRAFNGVLVNWSGRTDQYLVFTAPLGTAPAPVDITVKWSGIGDLPIDMLTPTGSTATTYNIAQAFVWNPGNTTDAYETNKICEQTYTIAPEALPSWWDTVYPLNGSVKAKRETAYYFGGAVEGLEVNMQQCY